MSIPLEISLDGLSLQATTPAGRTIQIPLNMAGLRQLKELCRWDAAQTKPLLVAAKTRREGEAHEARMAALQAALLSQPMTKVCHCDLPADTSQRCEGCPGPAGAGFLPTTQVKVTKLQANGKPHVPTLAELGLL